MSDQDAETAFRKARWADGEPVCPHCGGVDAYESRHPSGALRFTCKACAKDFTLTSSTLFASHKLPLRVYLAAILLFCNEVKGKSMLALSRELGVSYKAAFVLAHKIREAKASERRGRGGRARARRCHAAGREVNRRVSNGEQTDRVASLALASKPSVDFTGYWQRHLS